MARRAAREAITAWLGEEIRLERGKLSFDGSLRIDGTFVDGTLTGPVLIVGKGAKVSGKVRVKQLIVYGRIDARAYVLESATIAAGGVFSGEVVLEKPVLTVEEGGVFQGRVRMARRGGAAPQRTPAR